MRSLDWSPHKKKEVEHRATHRKSHVKMKTEIKMIHKPRDASKPPEAGEGHGTASPSEPYTLISISEC